MQHDHDEPQAYGQEAADDAKVWRQYVEEATEHDAHMLNEWSRNVDVSLIFAGLFSAVVATFAAQSYETLSIDPQDATNAFLASILAGQTATNSGRLPSDVEAELASFTPSTSAVWINALWFTSLVCSLGVASVGMLVKQWLGAYSANLPASPRLRARVRQHRYDTLRSWYTHHIINCLPFALSLCLILFLSGLVMVLLDSYRPIGLASLVLFSLTVGFHAFSVILPALTNCPWKTAVSPLFYHYLTPLRLLPSGFRRILQRASTLWRHSSLKPDWLDKIPLQFNLSIGGYSRQVRVDVAFSAAFNATTKVGHKIGLGTRSSVRLLGRIMISMWSSSQSEVADEEIAVTKMKDYLDSCAMLWMVSTSTKRSVVDCALQSMAGLPLAVCDRGILHNKFLRALLSRRLTDCIHGRTVVRPDSAELYVRSLYRNRLSHETSNKVSLKTLDSQLLHNIPVDPTSPLYITLICAKAMLNEVLDCLARAQAEAAAYSSYHIQLMVTTITHELAGRKGPSDVHWVAAPSGGWAHISSRALPILVRLLTITPPGETPSALDISIAKCIVVLTNGSIEPDEETSSNMFDEYILGGFAAIIRFPASHGCDNAEDISVVYNKYSLAVRRFAGRLSSGDAATVAEILRAFFRQPPGCWDIQNIEGILAILARSNANALRAIDSRLVVYVLQNVTSLASPPASLTYHLLVCVERLILECDRTEDLVSAFLVDSIAKLIYVSIRHSPHLGPIQSQAFRLLIIIGHQSCFKWTPFQRNTLIKSGLLEASREFFDNPSSIIQGDLDLWVETLVRLGDANKVALMESRAVDSLLQWTIRNWRGHEMTAPHMEQLRRLAESLGIKIDLSHDPTWFRELAQQKESLSKPVAR